MYNDFLSELENLSVAPALAGLARIYADLATEQQNFTQAMQEKFGSFSCPPGCGKCCENFVPDITQVEADYLAAYILKQDLHSQTVLRARLEKDAGGACPLSDPTSSSGACTAYAARPLLCRLFGYAGSRDKNGATSFALCKEMPPLLTQPNTRHFSSHSIAQNFRCPPPLMPKYGERLIALKPEHCQREPLPDLVKKRLEHLEFLQSLK